MVARDTALLNAIARHFRVHGTASNWEFSRACNRSAEWDADRKQLRVYFYWTVVALVEVHDGPRFTLRVAHGGWNNGITRAIISSMLAAFNAPYHIRNAYPRRLPRWSSKREYVHDAYVCKDDGFGSTRMEGESDMERLGRVMVCSIPNRAEECPPLPCNPDRFFPEAMFPTEGQRYAGTILAHRLRACDAILPQDVFGRIIDLAVVQ